MVQCQLQPVPGETILVVIGRIREMRRIRPEVCPQTLHPVLRRPSQSSDDTRQSSHEACREERACLGNRRCHNSQTHRPDRRLGNQQVSQSPRCDYNKTVENNNPVPGRYSEKIADAEIDVLELDSTGNAQCIKH